MSQQEIKKTLFKFFPSLKQYPEKYLPLIFEQYSEVPKHLAYLCPLCLENYFYAQGNTWRYSQQFTLDHFPPQNVGGTNKILVCEGCNKKAGHAYENSFKERVIKEAFNRKIPNIELPSTTNMDNVKGWMHSYVSNNEQGELSFQLHKKSKGRIPPLTEYERATNNDGKGFKMNIVPKNIDSKKFTKAILKTAYLYCFDYWGYEFVFSHTGKLFRDILNEISNYPIDVPTIWYDNKAEIHKGITIPIGLVFTEKPKEILSMYVNVPATLDQGDYRCIIPIQIPNPYDIDLKEMIRIQQFLNDHPDQEILLQKIPFEFSLAFPKPYTKTWDELTK